MNVEQTIQMIVVGTGFAVFVVGLFGRPVYDIVSSLISRIAKQ